MKRFFRGILQGDSSTTTKTGNKYIGASLSTNKTDVIIDLNRLENNKVRVTLSINRYGEEEPAEFDFETEID